MERVHGKENDNVFPEGFAAQSARTATNGGYSAYTLQLFISYHHHTQTKSRVPKRSGLPTRYINITFPFLCLRLLLALFSYSGTYFPIAIIRNDLLILLDQVSIQIITSVIDIKTLLRSV